MKRSSSCSSNIILKPNKLKTGSYLEYIYDFNKTSNNKINFQNFRNSYCKEKNVNKIISELKDEICLINKNIRETNNKVDYFIRKHSSEKKCKNNSFQIPNQSRGLKQNYSSQNLISKGENYYNEEYNKNNYNQYINNEFQNNLLRQKLTYEYDSNLDFLSNGINNNEIPKPKTYNYFNKIIKNNYERKNYYCPNTYENSQKYNSQLNQNYNKNLNRNYTPERLESNYLKNINLVNNICYNITPERENNLCSNFQSISKNYNFTL